MPTTTTAAGETKTTRPTISTVHTLYLENVKGRKFFCPKTSNKGKAGQFLEGLLGIPTSPACLDCEDGEVKLFPVRILKNGSFTPKETISITTRGLNHDKIRPFSNLKNPDITWENSAVKKKTNNLLFIAYIRDGDTITFLHSYLFNSSCPEYAQFQQDYETIMQKYRSIGVCQLGKKEEGYITNTINGKYMQGRTKGPGGSNKTVGFYFRPTQFVKNIILSQN